MRNSSIFNRFIDICLVEPTSMSLHLNKMNKNELIFIIAEVYIHRFFTSFGHITKRCYNLEKTEFRIITIYEKTQNLRSFFRKQYEKNNSK